MKKTMLILTALFAFTVNANEVKVGKSLQDSPENIAPAFHNTPKRKWLGTVKLCESTTDGATCDQKLSGDEKYQPMFNLS